MTTHGEWRVEDEVGAYSMQSLVSEQAINSGEQIAPEQDLT